MPDDLIPKKRGGARPGAGRKKKVLAANGRPIVLGPNASPHAVRAAELGRELTQKFELSPDQVMNLKGLAMIGCTREELAIFFGVSRPGLRRELLDHPEFMAALEEGFNGFKISIRRKLFLLADHHVGAAIFLAKNYLGMKDVIEAQHTGKNGEELFPMETLRSALKAADEAEQQTSLVN